MMKKIMTKVLTALSVLLVVLAVLNSGMYLASTLVNLLGYAIYIGVFSIPAVYFYHKWKKEEAEEQ